jgi:hypothetical protein
MKRNIYKNVKVVFFTLFVLIIILALKSNFLKNLTNILKFDENKRIEKIYGYCGGESIGYLKSLKKRYNFKTNPRIINYVHTTPTKWSIYTTDMKENDENQMIILNYPGNEVKIELNYYKDNFYELADAHYLSLLFKSIKKIEIKDSTFPITNIKFYLKDWSNKMIMQKSLKIDKGNNNSYKLNQKLNFFDIKEKRFFLKFNNLKKTTKIFVTLDVKYNLKDYKILDNFKNCYLVE